MSQYRITVQPRKTMFGKRTGSIVARLESDFSANVYAADGQTATEAKANLIDGLGRLAANDQRRYLFCGNEERTVLVVSFAGGAWQYDIIDPTRPTRSGCIMNVQTFKEAVERAYEHANGSYGGVINAL